jgi:YidC/Oxa1 family membrane protein insertase
MFETLIVQPIFNLLVFVYAVLPGHNFGLAIIVFTIIIRLLMWPLVKKQLHHTKQMRKLAPELKKIKEASKGDRQKKAAMEMELYKERGISPFSAFPMMIVQLIILFGLFSGLQRVVANPEAIINFSYDWINQIGALRSLAEDITRFDSTLFGVVDLTRAAIGDAGIYWPAMFIVVGSVVTQYFQSMQLMPQTKDSRKLREILRDAKEGKEADATETNAAVGRSMRYFIPGMIFIFTVGLPSALGLYWLVGGLVGYLQQARVLKQDEEELDVIADAPSGRKKVIDGEVIKKGKSKKSASTKQAKTPAETAEPAPKTTKSGEIIEKQYKKGTSTITIKRAANSKRRRK